MQYAQTTNSPTKWDVENFLGLWDTNELSIGGRKTRPSFKKQEKKRSRQLENFSVSTDQREKVKTNRWKNTLILPEGWKSYRT